MNGPPKVTVVNTNEHTHITGILDEWIGANLGVVYVEVSFSFSSGLLDY